MDKPTKFCYGCKYFEMIHGPEYVCDHPMLPSPISGNRWHVDCWERRSAGGECGPSGLLWEPKE